MKRLSIATLALAAMMVGLIAGPAFAQDASDPADSGDANIEGYTVLDCAVDIAFAYEVDNPAVFEDAGLDDFFDVTGDVAAEDEQALVDAVGAILAANNQTFAEVCSIYAVAVLPEVEPEPEPEPEPVVEEKEEPVVMGQVIARTGADTTVLLFGGLFLLGLGYVAIRRTRPALGDDA